MWTKRKSKNRRFERDHILDVKVQSRQLRSVRVRMAASLLARVLGAITVLFLVWQGGIWFVDEFIFRNPAFAIEDIGIETDGILPESQLQASAGVKMGDNLLALDLARVQRDLEYLPWIQSAAVERVRPRSLKIRVAEREPVAQTTMFELAGPDGKSRAMVFYFDADGWVMLPLASYRLDTASLGFDALPMLTGVAGVDLRPGRRVESHQLQAALRLIEKFARSPMYGLVDITSVDVSLPQLLQVSSSQGTVVTFGVENLDKQLKRWHLVYDYALRAGKSVASLDLSVSNNVPARLLEASAPPPPPRLKPSKPSLYRKKHV